MMVDWEAITRGGITTTNYQLFPGDRIYIKADGIIRMDNAISKVIAPFERMMGFTILGHGLVRTLQFGHIRNQNFGNNNGGF
jgi:hypothetical protein